MAKKPPKGKTEKLVFDWMRGASDRSRKAWEKRWREAATKGKPLGPKGVEYIKTLGPSRVPPKRREEDEEVIFEPPRKAERFTYVEEPVGRVSGKTRKRKK